MEDIIHHKVVIEDFFTPNSTGNDVTINLDSLKKLMSCNEAVSIKRKTIIVSENTQKNTVSLKLYLFEKKFVKVKKIERRKFKIKRKTNYSLTINKITGEYSIYFKNLYKTIVRKNITSDYILKLINYIQNGIEFKGVINDAIREFYDALGYHDLGLSYTDLIQYYFGIKNAQHNHKSSALGYFPFLNYLKVKNIDIIDYGALDFFRLIFKYDKKRFNNCTIIDYMSYYYDIEDKKFLDNILAILIKKNHNVLKFKTKPSSLFKIDYLKIKLYKHFNSNLKSELIFSRVAKCHEREKHQYDNILRIIKNLDLNVNDVLMLDLEIIGIFIFYITLFDMFGLKLKIKDINDFESKHWNIIFKNLIQSYYETGFNKFDEKTIRKFKRYFKNSNFDVNEKADFGDITSKNFADDCLLYKRRFIEYKFNFFQKNNANFFKLILTSEKTPNTLEEPEIIPDLIMNADFYKNDGYLKAIKLVKKFNITRIQIGLKFLFSKSYFENLCKRDKINVSDYLVYTN